MHLRAGAEARIYLVTANQQLGEVWADSTPCTHTSRYFSSPARNDDALNLCSTVQYATPHSYCGNYCRWAACQPGATSTPTPSWELSVTDSQSHLPPTSVHLSSIFVFVFVNTNAPPTLVRLPLVLPSHFLHDS